MLVRRAAQDGRVYLTFDDGPHPNTNRLLDILKAEEVPATFFVVGEEVEKYPDLLRRILAEGHAVGGHSWSHEQHSQTDFAGVWSQVSRTKEILRGAGVEMISYRPPFGHLTVPLLLFAFLRKIRIILWSVDSDDDNSRSADMILQNARWLRSGDIFLLHDDNDAIVKALPILIHDLRARGLSFGVIGETLRSAH